MARKRPGNPSRRRGSSERKPSAASIGRLCKEVERTLSLSLGDALDNDHLAEIMIVNVVPAPDESRLRVEVAPSESRDDGETLALLEAAKGPLVHAVADALSHRRRVPDLVFAIARPELPPPATPPQ